MRASMRDAVRHAGAAELRRASPSRRAQLEMQAFAFNAFVDRLIYGEPVVPGTAEHALYHTFYDFVDAERAAQGLAPAERKRVHGGEQPL